MCGPDASRKVFADEASTVKGQEEERVYDRSFRLRHHEGQLRADRYSLVSGLAGALLSGSSGAVTGVVLGTLTAALHTNLSKKN